MFAKSAELDLEIKVALAATPGKARKAALELVCRKRYLGQRATFEEEMRVTSEDKDRVRTRLLAELEAAKQQGGSGVWTVFKALGRARASLAGKMTQPKRGKPGMQSVKPSGGGAVVRGKSAVLRQLQVEAAKQHQEGGASTGAVLDMITRLES
jgi:hypothetical protein